MNKTSPDVVVIATLLQQGHQLVQSRSSTILFQTKVHNNQNHKSNPKPKRKAHLPRASVDGNVVVDPLVKATEGSDHVLVVHVVDVDLQVVCLPPCSCWYTRPKLKVDLELWKC